MRFMMMIKSDAKAEAGILPDAKLLADMGKLMQDMQKAGVLVAGEGLQASSKGARIRMSKTNTTVTDGPFSEAKELIAGYWLLEVKSKEEAIEWAKRVPNGDGEIELRQVYELADFPADPAEKPDGWRDAEQKFRDEADVGKPSAPARKSGTTRFIAMLKSDKTSESGVLPNEKVLNEMGALMDELAKSGALLAGEGLKPSAKGAIVRTNGGKRTVIDGPFTEGKEMIAGFSMIQVPSKADAIDFAKRWLRIHNDGLGVEDGQIEVRPLFEMSDFPA